MPSEIRTRTEEIEITANEVEPMKAILEFQLPEDQEQHRQSIDGMNWALSMWDLEQFIRNERKYNDKLTKESKFDVFKEEAEKYIFKNIKNTLKDIGLTFDSYYNENSLYENKKIYEVVDELNKKGLIYKKDNATWFKGTKVGRDVDRVLIKSTGEPTYRLPDMAYHITKFERGYDLCIDIFGADHLDAYPDVLEVLNQLDYDSNKVNNSFIRDMKKFFFEIYNTIASLISRDSDPIIINTYMPKFYELLLQIRLGIFPRLYIFINTTYSFWYFTSKLIIS